MAQQTAVEWLIKQMIAKQNGKGDSRSMDEIFDQAKEMEKQQNKDAWYDSRLNNNLLFDDYYEITYGK